MKQSIKTMLVCVVAVMAGLLPLKAETLKQTVPAVAKSGKGEIKFDDSKLSTEQKKQLDDLREAYRKASEQLREQSRAKRKELRVELDKPVSDMARIGQIKEQMKQLYAKRIDMRVEAILKIKAILGPGNHFGALGQGRRHGQKPQEE